MFWIFYKRHSSIVMSIGLSLAFFLIQFSFIDQYGVSWDEPLHRNWGKIFYLFLRTGDRHFLELMPGHGINYGPVYYLVNYLLSEKIYALHLLSFVAANHILNLLTASTAVGVLFLLALRIGSKRIAFLAVLFFTFFPPFIAHAHYNPKDIPLMTAILITSAVFIRALHRSSRQLFVLTGFLFGFCIALKVSALLMLPAFACTYLFQVVPHRNAISWKRELGTVALTTCAILVGAFVAWPSAWGDPLLIPKSVLFFTHDFWPGKVLFFGTEYSGVALPWYYIPFEYLTSMPTLTVLAMVFGIGISLHSVKRQQSIPIEHAFLLLWVLFPILFSMKPGLVRYDGMRQFFFCLPAIAMLAALGFDAFLRRLETAAKHPCIASSACITILFFSLLHEVILLHPFEGSYRNELLRLAYPSDLDRTFQIEFWGPTYKKGIDWLWENAPQSPVICVPTAGILVTWYPWRDDFMFECSAKSTFVMFFTRYSEAQRFASLTMPPVFTIERMNSELLKIYQVQ